MRAAKFMTHMCLYWGNDMRTKTIIVGLSLIAFATPTTAAAAETEKPTCLGEEATIVAGDGESVEGTNGRDVIVAASGQEGGEVIANGGNDLICGGGFVFGGRGSDTVVAADASAWGGPGDDRYLGLGQDDWFSGDRGNDTMVGRKGDDVFSPGPGRDRFRGGSGTDEVDYLSTRPDLRVNLTRGVATGQGRDILRSVDSVESGLGDDVLIGSASPNYLYGSIGHDTIRGRGGDDRLVGGDGRDHLHGNGGDDRADGDRGRDVLRGGKGDDRVRELPPTDGEGDHDLAVDRMYGGPGADFLGSLGGDDRLFGGNGADTFQGRRGNDVIVGGNGSDDGNAGPGRDRCIGSEKVLNCEVG